MKKHIYSLLLMILLGYSVGAQDNFSVDLDEVPTFLNVCGDPDRETVIVSVRGGSTETRSNIVATARLFPGVQFDSFDALSSTPGVSLLSAGDPSQPVFSLPNMSLSRNTQVSVVFNVRANCEYIDTLRGGSGIFDVLDIWEFDYDMGTDTGLNESDATIEYRDALAFPIFVTQMNNNFGPAKLGDCFDRTLTVNNTGVAGFVDTLVYENIQGAGVSVRSVIINGIPATITKTLVGTDTLITAGIGAAEFLANGNGNADVFFDPNESLEVVENVCLIDCDGDRTSMHLISWGCDSRYCETISENDFVPVGLGAADILVEQQDFATDIDAGYCQQGITTLTFTNIGIEDDPGFATMVDLAAGINFRYDVNTGMGQLTDGAFEIVAVEIAGINVTTISDLISLDGNPQFLGVDPDGPGGLSDFDGDGYYDDLATGESVKVRAYYDFNCSAAVVTADNCYNNVATSFNGIMEYNDLCGNPLVRRALGYASKGNIEVDEEITASPDADLLRDTFYIVYRQNRQVSNFSKSCSNGEEYQVTVALPDGVNPVLSETNLMLSGVGAATLKSHNIVNDTLTLIFDAAQNPLGIPLIHTLTLGMQADCSTETGETSFPLEFAHYCPDCDCRHLWYCGVIPGPWLHTTDPPCSPPSCPYGLGTQSFTVERTTIGYTDNQYTTPYDRNLANLKAALPCDSVEMTIATIVGDTDLNDSIGMVITYNNPDGTLDTEETFNFVSGNLYINRGGTIVNCPVDASQMTLTAVDSTKRLNFDLSECLTDNALTVQAGDTVNFVGKFTINPTGPYETSEFSEVPNLRGYGYAIDNDSTYICDSYGEEFEIGGLETFVAFPNSSTLIQGCGQITLNIKINPNLNEYVDRMGQEHRMALRVDSVVVNFDTNIFNGFDRFDPEVSFPGHPIVGNDAIPMPAFTDFSNGRYVIHFDTLNWGPSLIDALAGDGFDMAITVLPNCQTFFGSSLGFGNEYVFNPELYFVKNAYALEYGDGSCAEVFNDANTGTLLYVNPPRISFNPVSNPNYTLTADTAEWIVQYCNPDFDRDIGFSWISIEDSLGMIEVVSMEDISLTNAIVDLPFRRYGASNEHVVAYSDGLLRADGSNSLAEVCNTVRIRARVNRCGLTGFKALTGWNCMPPSDPNWTPEDYDPCNAEEIDLSVTTLDPFIDADLIDEPDDDITLCDVNTIEILVKNTQRGNVFDVTTDLILPLQGASLVPGSVEIAYPADAAYQAALADPVLVGTSNKGNIYRYEDFSQLHPYLHQVGLPGFDAGVDVDSSRFTIRYQFTTDCDFRSGSIAFYSFDGQKGCGDPSNVESGETQPLDIDGAPDPDDNAFDILFDVSSNLIPGEISTIEIIVVNQTNNPSDATDKLNLQLPLDVEYLLGSTAGQVPNGWVPGDPLIDTLNTIQDLIWDLPIGLQLNDTARLNLMVRTPVYDCDDSSLEVGLFTLAQADITCITTMTDCTISTVTSTNGGALTDLPIQQNQLTLRNPVFTSSCLNGTFETVNIGGTFVNFGDPLGATNINVRYYVDNDGNGSYDGSEPEYISFAESGPLATGERLDFNHSFPLALSDLCGLLLVVDSAGLGLCQPIELALGEPQLVNAGADELYCASSSITINTNLGNAACAGLSGYTYAWTAIAPASTADLSSTTIANPTLNVSHAGIAEDTLRYVLATTRTACGGALTSTDTVNIIRSLEVELDPLSPVYVNAGDSVTLEVLITNGGAGPYTYEWSPSASLTDPTAARPEAFPTVDTEYLVTVTSASGCSATSRVQVLMGGPVNGTVNVRDSIICPGDTIQLVASGGTDFLWLSDVANPAGAWLSAANIANPRFSGALANATYQYQVVISNSAFPGSEDTLDVTIRTYDIEAQATASTTTSCTGETVTLTGTGGSSQEWYTGTTLIGSTSTVMVNPTVTTDYFLVAYHAQGCTDTARLTVTVADPPQIVQAVADFDNCQGDTTRVAIQLDGLIDNYRIAGSGAFANAIVMGNRLIFDAIYTGGLSTFDVTLETLGGGCSVVESFVIRPCACTPPTLNSVIVTEATCEPPLEGLVTINLNQNPNNYEFSWLPNLGQSIGSGHIRRGLPAGIYEVRIAQRSAADCELIVPVAVTNTDGPDATVSTSPATCALNDGGATLSPPAFAYRWDDGFTGAVRNDLAAGIHPVTVTDPSDPACPNYLLVEVTASNPLQAEVVIDAYPNCLNTAGQVTLNVSGGSGSYDYSWPSGTNTQDNLGVGVYTVTVTDRGPTGCELEVLFALPALGSATVVIDDTTEVTCAGLANGAIDFTLSFDPLNFTPGDTLIVGQLDTFENGQLGPGQYCLLILDDKDCLGAAACFDIAAPEAMDLLLVVSPDCNGAGAIDLTVNGGTAPFTYDWVDLGGSDNPEDRTGIPGGQYAISVTDDNDCGIEENAVLVPACPFGCDFFFGEDSLMQQATDCAALTQICMDIPTDAADQFVIYDNGVLYTDPLEGCIFATQFTYNYGGVLINPPFDIVWQVDGTPYNISVGSIDELVDSMNVWDPVGEWTHIPLATTILGGGSGNLYLPMTVTDDLVGIPTPINPVPSRNPLSMGIQVDTGFHQIVVLDTTINCADTLYAWINCLFDDGYTQQGDSLCIGESFDFFIDTTRLQLAGNIIAINPGCAAVASEIVEFTFDEPSLIISYTGLRLGIDTACYEFVDDQGGRDTLFFTVKTLNCSNGMWVCDSVFVFQTKEDCPDTTVLDGPVARFENICADQGSGNVDFFLNPETNCVEYTGVELGRDTACVVLCDEFGFCDTTFYCIEVVPYFDPPIANNDFDTTVISTPVVIDIKSNDILFGGIDTAYILSPPLYGTIGTGGNINTLNLDCSVTYNAGDEFCEREDQFSYVVCTPNGCDTATVFVWLECTDIVIFNAVSPNGDSFNDFFHVAGILDFPDSRLLIYNRWGNLVFETVGYQNDWGGEWKNDKEVPDGTYYYILELNDDDDRVFNGYLELYR
ncbi:MAG: gliding motility-associated C-terminal domain-containing protein [Bacteroidota bacterium]